MLDNCFVSEPHPRPMENFALRVHIETEPLNIITDSQYAERVVLHIETAEFISDESELTLLFIQLQDIIRNRKHHLYITHIRSHTGLPGPLAQEVEIDRCQCKSTYNNIKKKTSPESSPPPTPRPEHCNVDKAEENDLKNSLMKMLEEAFEEKKKNDFKEIKEKTNKKLEEINKEIKEKNKKMEEMNKEIEEKNKKLEEKNKEIEEKQTKNWRKIKNFEEKTNKKLEEIKNSKKEKQKTGRNE
ncbi:hypothetical protein STEG23_021480 [Scotinomys teguina]